MGRFVVPTQGGSVLYVCTKFEADRSFRSKVIRGSQISHRHRPLPGGAGCQNLISWRWSLPAPIDQVWWRSVHGISSYRGNRHRPPAQPPATNTYRQDRLQYTAPLASAQCNYWTRLSSRINCRIRTIWTTLVHWMKWGSASLQHIRTIGFTYQSVQLRVKLPLCVDLIIYLTASLYVSIVPHIRTSSTGLTTSVPWQSILLHRLIETAFLLDPDDGNWKAGVGIYGVWGTQVPSRVQGQGEKPPKRGSEPQKLNRFEGL